MGVYDYEEADAQPEWHDTSNLCCRLCWIRLRMPGHWLCSYCDYVGAEARTAEAVIELEKLLAKNVAWSEYQVTHGLI